MKKVIATFACFMALFAFAATQVTKEYVDRKDGEITNTMNAHVNDKTNPHGVSAQQIGACTSNEVSKIVLILDGQTYSLENEDGVWSVLRAIVTKLGGSYVEDGITNVPKTVTNGVNQ